MLKRIAGIQQLPTGSFSCEGCVNESPDIAEALVLGRVQGRLEQCQHFKCSSTLPGILGRGMAAAGTTSLGRHLGVGGTWEGRHQNSPTQSSVPLGRWLLAIAQPGSFTGSTGETAVEGNCALRVLGRVTQTLP